MDLSRFPLSRKLNCRAGVLVPGSYMLTVIFDWLSKRPAGSAYANQFIEEMKKSGFIQQAIERANLKGAVVRQ